MEHLLLENGANGFLTKKIYKIAQLLGKKTNKQNHFGAEKPLGAIRDTLK